MRHSFICIFIFSCVALGLATAEYRNGEEETNPLTPPLAANKNGEYAPLFKKRDARVRLRLFIDNFQLVINSVSRGYTVAAEGPDDVDSSSDTDQGVLLGVHRIHRLVDRQLDSWKTLYPTLDQLNSSDSLGDVSVERLPYESLKLALKYPRRLHGPHPERAPIEKNARSLMVESKATGPTEGKAACVRGCNANGKHHLVIWLLFACVVVQVMAVLSVFGLWSPGDLIQQLGGIYEATITDMNRAGLHLFQVFSNFGLRCAITALLGLFKLCSFVRQKYRRRTIIQHDVRHSSRYPPFLQSAAAGDIVPLHISENPEPPGSFSSLSSLSSYASELPFLWHSWQTKSDNNLYNPSNFDFVCILGEGYFGKVMQLEHRATGEMVAVKVMSKEKNRRASGTPWLGSDSTVLTRSSDGIHASHKGGTVDLDTLQGEVRAMLRVQNSIYADWSPRVLGTFANEDSYFIVMPFYERGDIIECMKRGGGCISRGLAKFYIAELISAIHFLHTLRIVHRDIKPENLLLGIDGHIVVADLGIAHVFRESSFEDHSRDIFRSPYTTKFELPSADSAVWLDDDDFARWEEGRRKGGDDFPFLNPSTENPHVITGEHGTPMYAAPEVLSGGKYSYGVDYYSMGIVYHQMLTGYLPLVDGGLPYPNARNSERRWILDLGRHDSHLQVLSTKERKFLEKVLQQDPFQRPSVSKMKADPVFADIDWDQIGRRETVVPPALRIRRRGSLTSATARCESVRFDSSSTCSFDSNTE